MNKKQKAMRLLRAAAASLKDLQGTMLFPGWDLENPSPEGIALAAQVASAARSIAADGIDFDHGNDVPFLFVSHLVRYIGDMLEE